jgi:hypothetical protein
MAFGGEGLRKPGAGKALTHGGVGGLSPVSIAEEEAFSSSERKGLSLGDFLSSAPPGCLADVYPVVAVTVAGCGDDLWQSGGDLLDGGQVHMRGEQGEKMGAVA